MSGEPPRSLQGTIDADFIDVELDTPTQATPVVGLPSASVVGKTQDPGAQASYDPALRLPTLSAQPWRRAGDEERDVQSARRVSIASVSASLVLAFLGFSIGFSENVLSVIGFGMEATLDGISSGLVLWRFKKGKQREFEDSEAASQAKEARNARRERNSSIGIGATFVASAMLLGGLAAWKALQWDPSTPEHVSEEHVGAMYTAILAWPSAGIFGFLAVLKFRLAKSLGSQVLRKDALCSVLGAVLALICAVAAMLEQVAESSPKAVAGVDATASTCIALILLVEGSRTLRHNLSGWQTEHHELT